MNISAPFIHRPVATTVLMCALVIFGWFAYRMLPVSELPNVDFPTIVVSATLPGADPETMASTVATPLEKELSTIAGIDSMSSVSSTGQTRITLQFVLERDIDAAAQDVQAAISQSLKKLPSQMVTPPSFRKVNPSLSPILFLAITGDHLPLHVLDDYAETYLAESLSMVSGVAQVNVYGSQQYAVRILLNPNALTARGIGIDEVATKLEALSVNQPSGTLQSEGNYYSIIVDGQLKNAKEFNEAIIGTHNDALVRLKDVGIVKDSVANDQIATWCNGKRAIVLSIDRQPGVNTVQVARDTLNMLPDLMKKIPGGVKVEVVYDRSIFINSSVGEVKTTLIFAVFLVLVVTYFFFNSIGSTLITALDFPTSIIATFAVMYLLSFSLDNLSLMGLILAVGFVIDDTIVVLENILRHMEGGSDRFKAALEATQEISFTVVSMTLSLAAVFIPILFMGGLLGRLFHEFAVVVGSAILFSGFVSLTLTPMLRSRFLSVKPDGANFVVEGFLNYFNKSREYYIKYLQWVLDHAKPVWQGVIVILIFTVALVYWIPKGFIPTQDTGIIFGSTQVQEGLNFPEFINRQQAIADIISKNPNIESLISTVGQASGGVSASSGGQVILRLKPRDKRGQSADEVIQQLRKDMSVVPGIKVFLQNPPAIRLGGISSSGMYQYIIQGTDWQGLQSASETMKSEIAKIPGVQDVNTDLLLNNPEIRVHVLRDKAANLGITPAQIETVLYEAYGNAKINTIITSVNQYPVIMEVDPKYQKSPNVLNNLYLKSDSGQMVPLNMVVKMEQGVGPLSVSHFGQLPAITLSFNLAPGVSLGSITDKVASLAANYLPPQVTGVFVGTAKTFQDSMTTLPMLLLFTIIVIYMVLAILYEHFIHPITILSALPFAAFGALLALFVFGQELNIFSFIGIIMLVGLVKKNGIIMIDFALVEQREKNCTAREAIVQACSVRYRPIMMTTMAAILATLPLAMGFGTGAESRRPLGIAVVGGLVFSQMLTLFITPLFYLTMEKWILAFRNYQKKRSQSH